MFSFGMTDAVAGAWHTESCVPAVTAEVEEGRSEEKAAAVSCAAAE